MESGFAQSGRFVQPSRHTFRELQVRLETANETPLRIHF